MVSQVHLLPETLFAHTCCVQSLKGIGLSAQSFVDLMFEFLFLLSETTELRLSYLNVAPLILAVAIVAFSRAKVNLAHAIVFRTIAAFLDHDVSEGVDGVGEFKTADGAVAITNDGHLEEP